MKKNTTLLALVQNYSFKSDKKGGPTINYVYPNYTADGLTEEFRFSESLRLELRGRASIVRQAFEGLSVVYSTNETLLLAVQEIAPRLKLDGDGSAIYPYQPLLFVGANESNSRFPIFVVKPLIDGSMAWFELTEGEHAKVKSLLLQMADTKPFKPWWQKIPFLHK